LQGQEKGNKDENENMKKGGKKDKNYEID